jgi:hypothetical protein
MLLALLPTASPHGATFGASAVSFAPDDAAEAWVLTEGWGLAHTTDLETWEWICEEAVAGEDLYNVLALDGSRAIVGTRLGLHRVEGCSSTLLTGTPEGTFFPATARYGAGLLGLGIAGDGGGIWLCDDTSCVASDLAAPTLFPKSALADGARAWATVVYEGTLVSELWRSDDGLAWSLVHTWPDGDTDPRLLYARGDELAVWRRTRTEPDTPELLLSHDGGVSWTAPFETGFYTDATPALLVLDDVWLLGSIAGARTWRSEDAGETWTEESTTVPAVRCAEVVDGVGYACGDHVQDGFDLSRTTDGLTWEPLACLETALPAACAEDTCGALLTSYQLAGSYGGGECGTIITPPEDVPEEACGCDGSGAGLLLLLPLLRRRQAGATQSGGRSKGSPIVEPGPS